MTSVETKFLNGWMVIFVALLHWGVTKKTHLSAQGSSFPLLWAMNKGYTTKKKKKKIGTRLVVVLKFEKYLENTFIRLLNPRTWDQTLFIRWVVGRKTSP